MCSCALGPAVPRQGWGHGRACAGVRGNVHAQVWEETCLHRCAEVHGKPCRVCGKPCRMLLLCAWQALSNASCVHGKPCRLLLLCAWHALSYASFVCMASLVECFLCAGQALSNASCVHGKPCRMLFVCMASLVVCFFCVHGKPCRVLCCAVRALMRCNLQRHKGKKAQV